MSATETISLPRNLPKRKVVSQDVASDHAFIKKLIWAYFFLLLFEGALRKWFLPGLSNGLLIIRGPIVIWIYYLCHAQGVSENNNKYLQGWSQCVVVAVVLNWLNKQTQTRTIA